MVDKQEHIDVIIPIGRIDPTFTFLLSQLQELQQIINSTHQLHLRLSLDGDVDLRDVVRVVRRTDWDKTAHIIYPRVHRGPAHARNTAFKASDSPYVMFIDSDDAVSPQGFANLIHFFTSNSYKWAAGKSLNFDVDTLEITSTGPEIFLSEGEQELDVIRKYLLDHHSTDHTGLPFHECAAIFRREAVTEVGAYDESIDFVYGEGLAFWSRLTRKYTGWFTHDYIYLIGQNPHSLTRSGQFGPKILADYWSDSRLDAKLTPSTGNYLTDLELGKLFRDKFIITE